MQTAWNKKNKMQGSIDNSILNKNVPKNKLIFIKKEIKKSNQKNNKKIILTSHLKRTIETAKKFKIKKFISHNSLNEYHIGNAEGLSKKFFYKNITIKNKKIIIKNFKYNESFQSISNRIKFFLKFCKKYNLVVCFAHGMWLRFFICIINNNKFSSFKKIKIKNLDMYIFENNKIKKKYFKL